MTLEQCWHRVPGGTAVAALELARELAARSDLELVGVTAAHRRPPAPGWRPAIETRGLPLPRIALYEAWHLARRPKVERATGRVDVIHATGLALPPRTVPLVTTIHDLAFLEYPEHFSRRGLHFFHRALKLSRAEADLVLCSSQSTLEHCRAVGFAPERLRYVPLGVRATRADGAATRRARERYGLDRPYVLWAGTVEPRKNLPRLLAAFALLDQDVELALVGPRGWNEDLAGLRDRLPPGVRERVRPLGFVPEDHLAPLYAGAEVFCFPSLLEGFGLPVLEAMAQGTPVVTSKGSSTGELGRDAAILVDPRSSEEIAGGIERALSDSELRRELALAGLARAEEYTWGRTASLVAAAYGEVVAA